MKRIKWNLYNGKTFIESFTSHNKAKKAMHKKIKESIENSLHTHYSIEKVIEKVEKVKKEPYWKGFKSEKAYWDWYDELLDDVRHGYM